MKPHLTSKGMDKKWNASELAYLLRVQSCGLEQSARFHSRLFFLISVNIILLKVKPSFVLNCRLCSLTNYFLAEAELRFLMVGAYIFCYL